MPPTGPKSKGGDWFGTPDAAAYLGVTQRTLYRLIDEGQVVAYQFGRVLRIKRPDLEAFVEAARVEAGTLRHLYPGPVAEEPDASARVERASQSDLV
ncbi:MAG: hypothetical protein NVS3B12_07420 [Acidimicrobiales bacterium]